MPNEPLTILVTFTCMEISYVVLCLLNLNHQESLDRQIDNEVKVCFMTAYDVNIKALMAIFALSSDLEACFIGKPIDIQEFIARIKSELRAT